MQITARPDAIATHVPLDPTGRITRDISCLHCGYNLRSLLPEQACPECGAPVEPSLRGEHLRFSDPRWLRRLAAGMTCILIGEIAFVAARYGAIAWLISRLSSMLVFPLAFWWILSLLVFGLPLAGIWLATSPEPKRLTSIRNTRVRIAARALAGACLLLMLAALLSPVGTAARPATTPDLRWMQLRHLLHCLLSTAGWVTFCIHMRTLGCRAGALRRARIALAAAAAIAIAGSVSSGIWVWYMTDIQAWLAIPPNTTMAVLRTLDDVALTLIEALVLLMAILYGRLLRRQTRLARSEVHEPATTGGA